MSDHLIASHSRRKKIYVLGTSRNKKYLKVLVLVLFAALAGLAYIAVNSGILADENPTIPQHLITRINSERLSHNLPPVKTDDASLANQAERMSQESRVSPMAFTSPSGQKSGEITDVLIYPKISWAVSSINLEPPLFDAWIAEDPNFQRDLLNRGYKNVGICISSDSYNYYIVTKWQ
jgi:uncharacterized protein YkwD